MAHVLNSAKKNHSYWNSRMAKELMEDYVEMLRIKEWSEERIVDFLEGQFMRETKRIRNWSQWRSMMEEAVGYLNKVE